MSYEEILLLTTSLSKYDIVTIEEDWNACVGYDGSELVNWQIWHRSICANGEHFWL